MKKQILTLALVALASAALAHDESVDAATPNKFAKPTPTAVKAKKAKKKKVAKAPMKEHWVCPMHDGGESDHPGACTKCGMDLVLDSMSQAEKGK